MYYVIQQLIHKVIAMKPPFLVITVASILTVLQACSNASGPEYVGGGGSTEKSFSADILPIFSGAGCTGCHGGNGGLTVTSVASLLAGGDHGPAIIAGNADGSNLIRKLSPTPPFGSRMPLGGPYLSDTTISAIRAWINEGAKNN